MAHLRPSLGFALLIGLMMADQAGMARNLKLGTLDGIWGGDRMNLEMTRTGGKLETDCASGAFVGPIKLAKDGSFSARGTFHEHMAGPQKADDIHNASFARFRGRLKNGIVHLSITTVSDKKERHFALRKDARVKLVRCY
jgi:hypothetical protein